MVLSGTIELIDRKYFSSIYYKNTTDIISCASRTYLQDVTQEVD